MLAVLPCKRSKEEEYTAESEGMKMKKLGRLISMVLVMVMLLSGAPVTTLAASHIRLNRQKASLTTGQTLPLHVSGTGKKVRWSSSKSFVATVSRKGVVTAKAKGSAVITARVSGKSLKCHVTVTAKTGKDVSGDILTPQQSRRGLARYILQNGDYNEDGNREITYEKQDSDTYVNTSIAYNQREDILEFTLTYAAYASSDIGLSVLLCRLPVSDNDSNLGFKLTFFDDEEEIDGDTLALNMLARPSSISSEDNKMEWDVLSKTGILTEESDQEICDLANSTLDLWYSTMSMTLMLYAPDYCMEDLGFGE